MTDLHLPRLDLARAVTDALARGRYVLMTDGDGRPKEITLDLKERPDDLFEGESRRFSLSEVARMFEVDREKVIPTDDHGPSVPTQGELHRSAEVVGAESLGSGAWVVREPGPIVYEFALQDLETGAFLGLEKIILADAPDQASVRRADYVHVYDRVTRERRTLKRPEPDRILTGLRDVAADLRGKPVEPPFGCAALPPVGPLTSTEWLRAGDVLRSLIHVASCRKPGDIIRVDSISNGAIHYTDRQKCRVHSSEAASFAFVGRPDSDGWMTWAGGENPVPGAVVEVRTAAKGEFSGHSAGMDWSDMGESGYQIVAFRIVDTPPAV